MPPNLWASSVVSAIIVSITSSTGDDAEHHGRLRRRPAGPGDCACGSAGQHLPAVISGSARTTPSFCATVRTDHAGIAGDETTQRNDARQARWHYCVENIDGIHRSAGTLDSCAHARASAERPGVGHADELRRHDAAGRAGRIAHQVLDGKARRTVEAARKGARGLPRSFPERGPQRGRSLAFSRRAPCSTGISAMIAAALCSSGHAENTGRPSAAAAVSRIAASFSGFRVRSAVRPRARPVVIAPRCC